MGLWRAAEEHRELWDEILLHDVRPDSPLLGALPEGWHAQDCESAICPVLTIPPDRDVLGALSRSRRRKIVHDRNRADSLGGVTTEFARADQIDEELDALFALHGARWQAAGEPGVLADPKVQAFHRAAAPALMTAGLLRLAVVRHEDASLPSSLAWPIAAAGRATSSASITRSRARASAPSPLPP
jgi:hypothetical protein